MIETTLLRHFVAVATTRNFRRAAETLNLSHSALSRSIMNLEDQVGAPLLTRTTRNVTLTRAGEAFLREARGILDRLTVATVEARRIASDREEKLVISMCPSIDDQAPRVVSACKEFRALRPDVAVSFTSVLSNSQPQGIRAGEADLGVFVLNKRQAQELQYRVIKSAPLAVAVPRVWGEPKRDLALNEIRKWPFIMPHSEMLFNRRHPMHEYCRRAGIDLNIVATGQDVLTTRVMLCSGIGAAFVADRADHEDYVVMPIRDLPDSFKLEIAVAWHEASTSDLVQEFVELALR